MWRPEANTRLDNQLSRMYCQTFSVGFSSGDLGGNGSKLMLAGGFSLAEVCPLPDRAGSPRAAALEGVPKHRLVSDGFKARIEGGGDFLGRLFPPARDEAATHRHQLARAVFGEAGHLDPVGR